MEQFDQNSAKPNTLRLLTVPLGLVASIGTRLLNKACEFVVSQEGEIAEVQRHAGHEPGSPQSQAN